MAIEINGKEYSMRSLKTKDLPVVSRILRKMNLKKIDIQQLLGEVDGKDTKAAQEAAGIEFVMHLITHIGDAEDELYVFFGDLIGMKPKEFANLDLDDLVKVFNELRKMKGVKNFFQLVSKSMR